jgi:hypothetical protein
MSAQFVVRLMFEWRGGCLWCGNQAALERFGIGPIEDQLALSPKTRSQLAALATWHDHSLNWDYPPDPGPWTAEESERFELAAAEVLAAVRADLGPEFDVVYVPL